jgi:hypothetical protein
MNVTVKIYWTPKRGNTADEYEDAYQPANEGETVDRVFYAAMEDGASEGYLSGKWADILVKEFLKSQDGNKPLINLVAETYQTWEKYLKTYLEKRQAENRPIQWYEEPGLENGAFSTFVGLTLLDGPDEYDKIWLASAVGDTCLFHFRRSQLIGSFPMQAAESFNSWPCLISSNPANNKKLPENIKIKEGLWECDDTFLMMSDALSAWFLKEHEASRQPYALLQEIIPEGRDAFVSWLEELRDMNEIKNDDVTLMSLSVSEC